MFMPACNLHTIRNAACLPVLWIAIASTCYAQSLAIDQPLADAPAAKPIDPMTWIAAAQDLRIAAQTTDQIVDKIGNTIEQTMLHLAQVSQGFDPLGLKAAMETVRQQNNIIRLQNETIYAAMKSENRRLQRENRRLKKALRKRSGQNDGAPRQ